jgi:hypothetical protein
MRVIPPVVITDLMLTSSTAAEPGVNEAAWSSLTTYAEGDKAILGALTHASTITIAAPAVVTWSANGLPNGTKVALTTTGSLPTGLATGTIYYVVNRETNTFQLSETLDGAAITTTGSQSGTHTVTAQVHRIYESLQGSNLNHPPAIDDETYWIDVGPTNAWACLDTLRNTRTWTESPFEVVLTPGVRINSIALLGLVADSVTIEKTSGADTVFSETVDLVTREVVDWYDYFFADFTTKEGVVRFTLPPFSDGFITVTITRASGQVGCGGLVIGNFVDLGDAEAGAQGDARNFSTIDRDQFGNATLIPRRSIPTVKARAWFDKTAAKKIVDARRALNATTAVWATLDEDDDGWFEPLLVLGVYKTFVINAATSENGSVDLEIEEI